jgi:glycosyltransferase involved in cell wall biosynthesis
LYEYSAGMRSFPSVSVVIPACSMDRWDNLREAVASVRAQTVQVLETVVVIDHHPGLIAKAASELPGVTVIANAGIRGASGARNTGAAASRGEMLAFLDDDAIASPNWLESLLQHFKDPNDLWSRACGRLCQVSRGVGQAGAAGVVVDVAGDGR